MNKLLMILLPLSVLLSCQKSNNISGTLVEGVVLERSTREPVANSVVIVRESTGSLFGSSYRTVDVFEADENGRFEYLMEERYENLLGLRAYPPAETIHLFSTGFNNHQSIRQGTQNRGLELEMAGKCFLALHMQDTSGTSSRISISTLSETDLHFSPPPNDTIIQGSSTSPGFEKMRVGYWSRVNHESIYLWSPEVKCPPFDTVKVDIKY